MTGLRPFSSYQARVVAYNSVKGGNASVEIGIMTLTDGMGVMWACYICMICMYTLCIHVHVLCTCVYTLCMYMHVSMLTCEHVAYILCVCKYAHAH